MQQMRCSIDHPPTPAEPDPAARLKRRAARSGGSPAFRKQAAFSLVELIVIMAIVAILAIGSSMMMGSKQSGAVRSMMDELEGVISNAHQAAVATGRDIALVSWGAWGDGPDSLCIAYGDASLTQGEGSSTNFIEIGKKILAGEPPTPSGPALGLDKFPLEVQQTVMVPFHFSGDSVQKRACIVVDGSDGWEAATGEKNEAIASVVPFTTEMRGVLSEGNNFCKGSGTEVSHVYISGYTKRFSRTAFIKIVGTSASGKAIPDGPMGLIVLMENGASVFRFYNPGSGSGDGKWKRI